MTEHKDVYEALLAAKGEIPTLFKDAVNPFYGKAYLTLGTMLRYVEPVLAGHGLVLVQPIEVVHIHDRVMRYVFTRLVHTPSGTEIQSRYPLQPVEENDPQKLG